jgi:MFS family permease
LNRSAEGNASSPTDVVLLGVVALVVAMGIGRFAFTPILPLMLRDGTLSATDGAQWAAANYVGYLLGALTARRFSLNPTFGLRIALMGIVLTTFGVGGLEGFAFPEGSAFGSVALRFGGAILRVLSGIFSAWVLVCTSSWCLAELARRQAAQAGAWIYTGVGLGIVISGTLTWLGGRQPAYWLWLELGALCALGSAFVIARLPSVAASKADKLALPPAQTHGQRQSGRDLSKDTAEHWDFILCYGIFAFGYIVPATFLPVMAQQLVDDPLVFGLTWPLFGLAASASVAASARWLSAWPRRTVWAVAQGVLALGAALPLFTQALWGLAVAALLVGGTFMVITMAALQLIRERAAANPTPFLARMTIAFATGQILGPLLVRLIGENRVVGFDAINLTTVAAASMLTLSSVWLWRDNVSEE